MVTAEVQVETKEAITTKQRELLKRVVKGFDMDEVLQLLLEEYGLHEVMRAIRER